MTECDSSTPQATLHRSQSAETIAYNTCNICESGHVVSNVCQCDDHVLLENNIVFLKCFECQRLFHLQCISEKIDLDKLLTVVETGYLCSLCQT